jgi:hypothetical protein
MEIAEAPALACLTSEGHPEAIRSRQHREEHMKLRRRTRNSLFAAAVGALTVAAGTSLATSAKAADQSWVFYNVATGRCLDDSQAYGLRTFSCNGASQVNGYQAFYKPLSTLTSFQFQNVNTKLCVDDSASGLRHFSCNLQSFLAGYQGWEFTYANDGNDVDLQIKNVATNLCLDDSLQYGLRAFSCNQASFDNGYQDWNQSPNS